MTTSAGERPTENQALPRRKRGPCRAQSAAFPMDSGFRRNDKWGGVVCLWFSGHFQPAPRPTGRRIGNLRPIYRPYTTDVKEAHLEKSRPFRADTTPKTHGPGRLT